MNDFPGYVDYGMEYLRRDIHKGSVVEQGETNAMHMPYATMKHVGTPSIYRLYRTKNA